MHSSGKIYTLDALYLKNNSILDQWISRTSIKEEQGCYNPQQGPMMYSGDPFLQGISFFLLGVVGSVQ